MLVFLVEKEIFLVGRTTRFIQLGGLQWLRVRQLFLVLEVVDGYAKFALKFQFFKSAWEEDWEVDFFLEEDG